MATVGEHYGRRDLGAQILAGARAAGLDVEQLAPDDLAPLDHFHTRGKEATLELARHAGLVPGVRALDVGGGIGGPARTFAIEVGWHVTVLDLTEEFCRVGEDLTRRTGLADRVTFRHGNALAMPFGPAAFDLAYTQHASMNIEDKEQLYREIFRVVKPGGLLAFHEILAGPHQPIHFPVPWAREASISHLRPPDRIRALLGRVGFVESSWQDQTAATLEWVRARVAAAKPGTPPPPLGLHLLLGADTAAMFRNLVRNLEEDRVRVVMAVCRRP